MEVASSPGHSHVFNVEGRTADIDWYHMCGLASARPKRSEISTRARELFRMASGRIFRARLNFLSYSLRRHRPHVAESKTVASLKMIMQGRQTLLFGWTVLTAYRVNQFSRGQKRSHLLGPKLFVLSLMVKMLQAVACQLVYSRLHSSKTDEIMELLLLLILQHID